MKVARTSDFILHTNNIFLMYFFVNNENNKIFAHTNPK